MAFKKLRGQMVAKGFTQQGLAAEIGISLQSLNNKLTGKKQFTLGEAQKIKDVLDIGNPGEIFFDSDFPKMQ